MKRIIAVICCVCLVGFSLVGSALADDGIVSSANEPNMAIEGQLNAQMEDLMKYFIENDYIPEGNQYPDFFGGSYFKNDNTELVICVTDNSEAICQIIRTGTKNPDVTIEKVEHSYDELNDEAVSLLNSYTTSKRTLSSDNTANNSNLEIVGTGVLVKENGILVTVKADDEVDVISTNGMQTFVNSAKELVRTVTTSEEDEFEYVIVRGGYIQEQASYEPGSTLNSPQSSGFTMGYRYKATHPDTGAIFKGFWTAGHCVYKDSAVTYTATNTYLGQCILCENNGYIDAAFVALDDQQYTTISNDLKYGGKTLVSTNYFITFPVDSTVYICGAATGEEKYGSIISGSYNFTSENGKDYYDFVLCNYQSILGDSGAAVYSHKNGDYAIVGIHRGEDPENNAFRVLTKHMNLKEEWDLSGWFD